MVEELADSARKLKAIPLCASLPLSEKRRSCLVEEDDAFVHIWGVVGSSTYFTITLTPPPLLPAEEKRVKRQFDT